MTQKKYTLFIIDPQNLYMDRFKKIFQDGPYLIFYCISVDKAKKIMSGVTPDIIIFRIEPETEEEDFLVYLQKKLPQSIRIVFSRKYIGIDLSKLVLCGLAHRYISMMWDHKTVLTILQRDLLTRSRLQASKCKSFFADFMQIPVLPTIFLEVQEILQKTDMSITDLVAVIEKDPVVATRLLQIVNSAAYTKKKVILDIRHAVTFLGTEQIRELILFLCGFQLFPPYGNCLEDAADSAKHSLLCSQLAGEIAKTIAPKHILDAATAALLHDLGKLVFFSSGCDKIEASRSVKDAFMMASSEYEKNIFGVSHEEVGSFLLLIWNLPMQLIESTANHTLPITKLWGIPLCVAIADRCLLEAQNDQLVTDIEKLTPKYPIEKWREIACQLTKNTDHLLNYL